MGNLVTVYVNGTKTEVPSDFTVIKAAEAAGIKIPSLCYHPDLSPTGNCGICLVEIKGQKGLKRACVTPVSEGMEIITFSNTIHDTRKTVLELILSNHPDDCLHCVRNGKCELRTLADSMGIREIEYEKNYQKKKKI